MGLASRGRMLCTRVARSMTMPHHPVCARARSAPTRLLPSDAFSWRTQLRVLKLGSGPGFLARYILETIPNTEYTMLDFSQAMHDLARTVRTAHEKRARYPGRLQTRCLGFKEKMFGGHSCRARRMPRQALLPFP